MGLTNSTIKDIKEIDIIKVKNMKKKSKRIYLSKENPYFNTKKPFTKNIYYLHMDENSITKYKNIIDNNKIIVKYNKIKVYKSCFDRDFYALKEYTSNDKNGFTIIELLDIFQDISLKSSVNKKSLNNQGITYFEIKKNKIFISIQFS